MTLAFICLHEYMILQELKDCSNMGLTFIFVVWINQNIKIKTKSFKKSLNTSLIRALKTAGALVSLNGIKTYWKWPRGFWKQSSAHHLSLWGLGGTTCTTWNDLLLAMRNKLWHRLYRDLTVCIKGFGTPYSQNTPHKTLQGTQSNTTKHMSIGWASTHAPSRILLRV